MAKRRMFSKDVIDTDHFLEMPMTAQVLYFHLALRADDDGFVSSPKRIMRLIGVGEDDMKILIAKSFIIPFDTGVCVIRHWKIHNYIQSDRYSPTVYQEEFHMLKENSNKTYDMDTECIQNGNSSDTQVRLGKVSLGKGSKDIYPLQCNTDVTNSNDNKEKEKDKQEKNSKIDYQDLVDYYHKTCPSLPKVVKLSDVRKGYINALLKEFSIDDVKSAFEKVENCPHLIGKNDRGWKADFEWLIKKGNLLKVIEGRYDVIEKKGKHKGSREGYDLDLGGYKTL